MCSGLCGTERAELAYSCLRLSLGVFLLNQTVFPFAGGEQGAGLQVMPDKDLEQAGDHDDHSARGDNPGHCDTNWYRRQHPQHHRSVLFLEERVTFDWALLRAQVSLCRVLARSKFCRLSPVPLGVWLMPFQAVGEIASNIWSMAPQCFLLPPLFPGLAWLWQMPLQTFKCDSC